MHSAAGPDDLIGDLCPACGSLLKPVGDLAEIVGFRSIKSRDGSADDAPPGTHQRIAGRVEDIFARRAEILAQLDGLGADDGGSLGPDALAQAIALPTPGENP